MEDRRQCALRGIIVTESECVNSCPAPEQRVVCAMESDSFAGQARHIQHVILNEWYADCELCGAYSEARMERHRQAYRDAGLIR